MKREEVREERTMVRQVCLSFRQLEEGCLAVARCTIESSPLSVNRTGIAVPFYIRSLSYRMPANQ